ncbi:MAG: sugar phosphate nucleotidyltransferase [Candidatus Bathyarchaeia archaeon]|nr:NTP transferase domain-containing protein [Candidatus Bathyarchaeota archaeon]
MKGVILAAGVGSRLAPITDNKPKHMIPLCGQPLISYVLTAVKLNGIKDLIIVIRKTDEVTKKFLGNGEKFDLRLDYAFQEKPIGTADALKSALDFIDTNDFLIVYGDILLSNAVIQKVLKCFNEFKDCVVTGASVESTQEYGLIKEKDGKLIDLIEKPKKAPIETLVNAGVYIFNKEEISKAIKETRKSIRGEYELTDSIKILLKKGRTIRVVKVSSEEWMDMGRPWDILEANKRVLSKIETEIFGDVSEKATLIGKVYVGKNAKIKPGSIIEGPTFIDEEAEVGPNSLIRPYTSLGKKSKIGNCCEIKNSVIMNNTKIAHLSYIGDSVIGEFCNIGAGAKIANLKLNEENVKMIIKGRKVDTGRRKLGAFLGDKVKIGINASIMPGVKIGSSTIIGPNVVVYKDVPSKKIVLLKQELTIRKV